MAADVSGVRDLLQAAPSIETGIIVPSGDVSDLANFIGVLVDDEELSRRLGRSAHSVAEAFSREDVGRKLAEFLGDRRIVATEER